MYEIAQLRYEISFSNCVLILNSDHMHQRFELISLKIEKLTERALQLKDHITTFSQNLIRIHNCVSNPAVLNG